MFESRRNNTIGQSGNITLNYDVIKTRHEGFRTPADDLRYLLWISRYLRTFYYKTFYEHRIKVQDHSEVPPSLWAARLHFFSVRLPAVVCHGLETLKIQRALLNLAILTHRPVPFSSWILRFHRKLNTARNRSAHVAMPVDRNASIWWIERSSRTASQGCFFQPINDDHRN